MRLYFSFLEAEIVILIYYEGIVARDFKIIHSGSAENIYHHLQIHFRYNKIA